MATEFGDNSIASVLKLQHMVFDEICFEREGFPQDAEQGLSIGFGRTVKKIEDGCYRVALAAKAVKEKEYTVTVKLSGYFEIEETEPDRETILNENAVAILFPYLRAELTLITSQPEVEPLVLPAVNINAMMKQETETTDTRRPDAKEEP